MKRKSALRFGIIAAGGILEYGFMPAVRLTEGVEAAAVAARNIDRAKAAAVKYGIPKAYEGYNKILTDPDIDCVYICTPNSEHVEWSRKALKAGKHVLCEKPAGFNAKEVASLAALIEKSGLTYAEAFQYRYHPIIKKAIEIARSGDIGEILNLDIAYRHEEPNRKSIKFQPELAGGAMMDVGCYPVSFSRFLAGCNDAEVLDVRSKMVNGVDGETSAKLRFSNGVTSSIAGSKIRTEPSHAVIAGSKGAIFLNVPFPVSSYENGKVVDNYRCVVQTGSKIRFLKSPTKFMYACQLEAFRDAVLSGTQPIMDIQSAIANMKILDAIRAKAGVPISKSK